MSPPLRTTMRRCISFFYLTKALLLSHDHADACFGLDDLRSLTLRGTFAPVQDNIPIYTSPVTYSSIANMFPYMVDSSRATGGGDIPSFIWHPFDQTQPFEILSCGGIKVIPLPVEHGMYFSQGPPKAYMCMGFRIGDLSYISDANRIPDETKVKIQGSRILILDALRETPHASHFSFDEVLPPERY
jgi:phosphoribosyl 1,2-cyclic phosphodiesterase